MKININQNPRSSIASRIRTTSTKRRTPLPRPTSESRLDRLLTRFSHISQTGLFVLTSATLYFTVVPLYKTALLEEQISRKEIELKELETKQENQYQSLRKVTLDSFVAISIRCFFGEIARPEDIGIKKPEKKSDAPLNRKIEECISDYSRKLPYLQFLNGHDTSLLQSEVRAINADILSYRAYYKELYDKVSPELSHNYAKPKKGNWLDTAIDWEIRRCQRLKILNIDCDPEPRTREIIAEGERIRIEQEFIDMSIERFKKIWDL